LGHSPVQLQPADSDRPRPAASGWPVSSVWLAGQLGPGSGASLDRIVSHGAGPGWGPPPRRRVPEPAARDHQRGHRRLGPRGPVL